MNIDAKKMAVISAAISTYIKTGEEAAFAAQAEAEAQAVASPVTGPVNPSNMWGASSRSDIMQMRTMMQRRAFK